MSFLIAIAVLLVGIGFLASAVVTLFVMVEPIGIALLAGYGILRLVSALRAIERERTVLREQREGERNV